MQKIKPHLWFDTQAKDAAEFYMTIFPNSKITSASVIKNTPSGDCDVMAFDIMGYSMMAISAGPYFVKNPSISFMINFDSSQDPDAKMRIDEIWAKLIDGGKALMPLDKYPFSERYGWVEDKFGVSWQLILTNPQGEERPLVMPSLLFTQQYDGKAEEATNYYLEVFTGAPNAGTAKRGALVKYPADDGMHTAGTVMFTDFMLENQWFVAMDGGKVHDFTFNEGVSLMVECETQEEIDYYWEKLSAVPEAEQCGWCKDKFGVAWQITPAIMDTLMSGDEAKVARVTEAFLKMKKFDIAELERAAAGN